MLTQFSVHFAATSPTANLATRPAPAALNLTTPPLYPRPDLHFTMPVLTVAPLPPRQSSLVFRNNSPFSPLSRIPATLLSLPCATHINSATLLPVLHCQFFSRAPY